MQADAQKTRHSAHPELQLNPNDLMQSQAKPTSLSASMAVLVRLPGGEATNLQSDLAESLLNWPGARAGFCPQEYNKSKKSDSTSFVAPAQVAPFR